MKSSADIKRVIDMGVRTSMDEGLSRSRTDVPNRSKITALHFISIQILAHSADMINIFGNEGFWQMSPWEGFGIGAIIIGQNAISHRPWCFIPKYLSIKDNQCHNGIMLNNGRKQDFVGSKPITHFTRHDRGLASQKWASRTLPESRPLTSGVLSWPTGRRGKWDSLP